AIDTGRPEPENIPAGDQRAAAPKPATAVDTGRPKPEKIPAGDQRAAAPKPATSEPPQKTVAEPSSDNGSRTGRTAPQNQIPLPEATQSEPKIELTPQRIILETPEETAIRKKTEVDKKLRKYKKDNPGKPIPLSREDLEIILIGDAFWFRHKKWKIRLNGNLYKLHSDGYFWHDEADTNIDHTSDKYILTESVEGIPPGTIFDGSDLNYAEQGIISGIIGNNWLDGLLIKRYNTSRGRRTGPGEIENVQKLAKFGYKLYNSTSFTD
nr:hypothetical protein [Verrucomicrobiota bacterium]